MPPKAQWWRKYMNLPINQIICGDNVTIMREWPDECIDLTVTSPPYDNLRIYKGFSWDFEALAKQLFRVTKIGGVVVWVVGDATINGSETGTSFKQALYFKEIGFNLHDTMIYQKQGVVFPHHNRYYQAFEYMFIISKGSPKSYFPIKDKKNITTGKVRVYRTERQKDGSLKRRDGKGKETKDFSIRTNVWLMHNNRKGQNTIHPAVFPLRLAIDHIRSWSNPGDLILDPFIGSGTTAIAAIRLQRKFIGIDIATEYCDLAKSRIKRELEQPFLFDLTSPKPNDKMFNETLFNEA